MIFKKSCYKFFFVNWICHFYFNRFVTSFYFYFFLSNINKNSIVDLKNFVAKKSLVFDYFFDYFFKKYMTLKLQSKILIKFSSYSFSTDLSSTSVSYFIKSLKKYFFFFKLKPLFLKNFLNFFVAFFFCLDAPLFLGWFKQLCEGVNFKFQKTLFLFLKFFLNFFFKNFNVFFNLKGFYLSLKGKLLGSGNSKKKKMMIYSGNFTLSNNKNRVSFSKSVIKTYTGVLGLIFFLVF